MDGKIDGWKELWMKRIMDEKNYGWKDGWMDR